MALTVTAEGARRVRQYDQNPGKKAKRGVGQKGGAAKKRFGATQPLGLMRGHTDEGKPLTPAQSFGRVDLRHSLRVPGSDMVREFAVSGAIFTPFSRRFHAVFTP